jgi:hypothetical protein
LQHGERKPADDYQLNTDRSPRGGICSSVKPVF